MVRHRIVAFASLLMSLLLTSPTPGAAAGLDAATQTFLEGIWLVKPPDSGACTEHFYGEMQLEFEFRKSGGRLVLYEHPDIFTTLAIPAQFATRDGDAVEINALGRDGQTLVHLMRARLLPPDRLESQLRSGKATILYRCADPDPSVNAAVPAAMLGRLTPAISGSQSFPEAIAGIPDDDLCREHFDARFNRDRLHLARLQFDLIGPVYYWVVADGFRGRIDEIGIVRSVQVLDSRTLRMELVAPESPWTAWHVPEPHGRRTTLTVIDEGRRIRIPELGASLVRCDADQPLGVGLLNRFVLRWRARDPR